MRQKYPRDEKGNVILGTEQGITITRPWNKDMYDHNEKVGDLMIEKICNSIDKFYDQGDIEKLKIIGKALSGYNYGIGFTLETLYQRILLEAKNVENFWLHDWAWPELVKEEIVKPIETSMVGYTKLK